MTSNNLNEKTKKWVGECLRKKKLKLGWADNIIDKAAIEGNKLYKYYCMHCGFYHVTKMENHQDRQ